MVRLEFMSEAKSTEGHLIRTVEAAALMTLGCSPCDSLSSRNTKIVGIEFGLCGRATRLGPSHLPFSFRPFCLLRLLRLLRTPSTCFSQETTDGAGVALAWQPSPE